MTKFTPLEERFWAKVVIGDPDTCWSWTAQHNNKGYGQIRRGGTLPYVLAHRVSYEINVGPIPEGLIVMHTCDNPGCVNPRHLRTGTMRENTRDMLTKGRNNCGRLSGDMSAARRYPERLRRGDNHPARVNPHYILRGSGHPSSILDEDRVSEILRQLARGEPKGLIAARFGVHRQTILRIAIGKAWAHVPRPS